MRTRSGSSSPLVSVGLWALTGYMAFCLLVQAAAQLAGAGRCGGRPPSYFNPAAGVGLFAGRQDWLVGTSRNCTVDIGAIWWIVGSVLTLLAALAAASALAWRTWKQSGAWLRQDILSRDGVAGRAEILRDFGARAVRKRGRYTRPGLSKPSIHDVSWTLGRSRGVTIHVSTEESMVIQGAPRSGKAYTWSSMRFSMHPALLSPHQRELTTWWSRCERGCLMGGRLQSLILRACRVCQRRCAGRLYVVAVTPISQPDGLL